MLIVIEIPKDILDQIQSDVEKEFPGDPMMQELHFIREKMVVEAELLGKSYYEYLKKLEDDLVEKI